MPDGAPRLTAIQLVAHVVEAYGFGHREIMEMPFITFMAYQRLATVENANAKLRRQFEGL